MAKKRKTAQEWSSIIDDWEMSGLSIEKYCREHKLTVSSFYKWKSQLNKGEQPVAREAVPDWLTVESPPQPAASHWDIELNLPGGVVLRVRQPC